MFKESRERYLVGRLRHAEELLSQGSDELDPERGGDLFRHKLADATRSQRKVPHDHSDYRHVSQDPCGLSEIEVSSQEVKIVRVNDTHHPDSLA